MRVLHVIPSLAAADGGPTTVVKELAFVARKRGDAFRIITTDKGLERKELSEPAAEYARSRAPRRWTFSPGLAIRVWNALPQADIVHVHSVHTFPTLATALMSIMRRRPFVIEPHGALGEYHMRQRPLLKALYFRCIDRPVLRMARALIVSSDAEYADATARLPWLRAFVIPLGVDERLFDIRPAGRSSSTVVFVGRLAEVKGVDILLRAWPEVVARVPDAELIVAGPMHRDLPIDVEKILRSSDRDCVRWLGPINPTERNELLRRCRVFVLPSRHESFGISVAEAMAAGVPVIVTANVGVSSDVAESGSGFVVSADSESLAQALIQALSKDMSSYGERARMTAKERFRWEHVYDRMQDIYRTA